MGFRSILINDDVFKKLKQIKQKFNKRSFSAAINFLLEKGGFHGGGKRTNKP